MAAKHSSATRWHLDEPLDLDWRSKALCRRRQDLPWTPDVEPEWPAIMEMRALCSRCLVASACASFGLTQPGGFYAGVWTPWKDGTSVAGEGDERGARFTARTSLRKVRDSATHDVPLNTPRSHHDARPVSLTSR